MSKKGKKGKRRARVASDGYMWSFHGSFTSKADAEAKARSVRRKLGTAWVATRRFVPGGFGKVQTRHVVMGPSSGVPF
jgi:hypothetical protein